MKKTQRNTLLKLLKKQWLSTAKAYEAGGGMNLRSRVAGYRAEGMKG